jgi:hypothetical protein
MCPKRSVLFLASRKLVGQVVLCATFGFFAPFWHADTLRWLACRFCDIRVVHHTTASGVCVWHRRRAAIYRRVTARSSAPRTRSERRAIVVVDDVVVVVEQ